MSGICGLISRITGYIIQIINGRKYETSVRIANKYNIPGGGGVKGKFLERAKASF